MDSNEEILLLALLIKRRYRRLRGKRMYWVDPILETRETHSHYFTLFVELRRYENTFLNYFGMSIASFDELYRILKKSLKRQNTQLRSSISSEDRLMITIRIGISTASKIVQEICQEL
ncbi:hypothetical protein ABEB36_003134 [Hypothenemus hampei]|uniref:Uncharacterized protein n=1 Tax=Hypothenemus hampei TaxID=57062 RepID=A0ABD1F854_HYPHA